MGWNATESSILNFIGRPMHQNYLVKYLRLTKFETREEEIKHTIQNYDFIGVSERMAESVVVMSMIFRVPLADLIVLSSKVEGYDDGTTSSGCVKIRRSWTTPKIDAYLAGDFLHDNSDIILYHAVNASLDLTIDALGRDKVMAGVVSYHELTAKNKRECEQRAIFPCPLTLPNHTILASQDCYFQDTGCGHKCTDEVLRAESDAEWSRLQNSR
ncbi:sulfotransferase family [Fragilaria crotonensis]|nr:sulfotransferase family [Fragilaria crotonensis]